MRKITEWLEDEWNEDIRSVARVGILFVLVIFGLFVNARICAVEDVSWPLVIYGGVLALLLKFGDGMRERTIIAIVIGDLVFTYLLVLIALPDLMVLHLPFYNRIRSFDTSPCGLYRKARGIFFVYNK